MVTTRERYSSRIISTGPVYGCRRKTSNSCTAHPTLHPFTTPRTHFPPSASNWSPFTPSFFDTGPCKMLTLDYKKKKRESRPKKIIFRDVFVHAGWKKWRRKKKEISYLLSAAGAECDRNRNLKKERKSFLLVFFFFCIFQHSKN